MSSDNRDPPKRDVPLPRLHTMPWSETFLGLDLLKCLGSGCLTVGIPMALAGCGLLYGIRYRRQPVNTSSLSHTYKVVAAGGVIYGGFMSAPSCWKKKRDQKRQEQCSSAESMTEFLQRVVTIQSLEDRFYKFVNPFKKDMMSEEMKQRGPTIGQWDIVNQTTYEGLCYGTALCALTTACARTIGARNTFSWRSAFVSLTIWVVGGSGLIILIGRRRLAEADREEK